MNDTPRTAPGQPIMAGIHPTILRVFAAPDEPAYLSPQSAERLEKAPKWFKGWLRQHTRVCHHKAWTEARFNPANPASWEWLAPWAEHFVAIKVSREEAHEATRKLAVTAYGYPHEQLLEICTLIVNARKEHRMSTGLASKAERLEQERREQQFAERARAKWALLTPAQRKDRLDKAIEENPGFKHLPRLAEQFAIAQIAEAIEKAAAAKAEAAS